MPILYRGAHRHTTAKTVGQSKVVAVMAARHRTGGSPQRAARFEDGVRSSPLAASEERARRNGGRRSSGKSFARCSPAVAAALAEVARGFFAAPGVPEPRRRLGPQSFNLPAPTADGKPAVRPVANRNSRLKDMHMLWAIRLLFRRLALLARPTDAKVASARPARKGLGSDCKHRSVG